MFILFTNKCIVICLNFDNKPHYEFYDSKFDMIVSIYYMSFQRWNFKWLQAKSYIMVFIVNFDIGYLQECQQIINHTVQILDKYRISVNIITAIFGESYIGAYIEILKYLRKYYLKQT